MSTTLRVAGVPEHFNLPFQSGVQRGVFSKNGVNLLWNAVPGGTGAMVQLVSSGEADVAVALTEGVVAAIVSANINAEKLRKENSSSSSTPPPPLLRCAGEFVASKLRWMVAAGVRHECSSLEDVGQMLARDPTRILRFSVSRLGSGSHLMAYLLAKRQGWPQDRLQFIVQKDFRTMRRGVGEERQSGVGGGGENEPADLLMWEWYMTKPFVDALELKALGYFDTPWHCFSFIARKDWLDVAANRELLKKASSIVFSLCREMMENEDVSCEEISAHFGIDLVDAHSWFNKVRYAQELVMPKAMVERVLEALASVGVIPPVLTKKETLNDDNNGGIVYDLQDIVDTRVARILQLDARVTSNSSCNHMSANEIIEDEADEEWESNVPMVSSRVVKSSLSSSSSSFFPYVESELSLINASSGGNGSATESGGITSTSEISLSVFDIGQQGISTSTVCLDDHHHLQQLQQPREVFLSTLSPGDSIIGAAHVRVKRDAAIGEAYERRASIERRASVGGGGGDLQLRESIVGVSETEDIADEEEVVDVNDVENYKDIEEVVDEEGDNEKSKDGRRLSGMIKLRSALPLPSTPSSYSTLSPSYASPSFSSFSPPQLRMPTKDSLVPTAGTTEYTLWKGKKRAALEAVLGHLDSYGGQTAAAADSYGRSSNASNRGEDSYQTGGVDFSSSSISLSTRTIVTPAQAVNVTRLNWIASGAAVDIG